MLFATVTKVARLHPWMPSLKLCYATEWLNRVQQVRGCIVFLSGGSFHRVVTLDKLLDYIYKKNPQIVVWD